eukprot:6033045-Prymnesium_polylepis.1
MHLMLHGVLAFHVREGVELTEEEIEKLIRGSLIFQNCMPPSLLCPVAFCFAQYLRRTPPCADDGCVQLAELCRVTPNPKFFTAADRREAFRTGKFQLADHFLDYFIGQANVANCNLFKEHRDALEQACEAPVNAVAIEKRRQFWQNRRDDVMLGETSVSVAEVHLFLLWG